MESSEVNNEKRLSQQVSEKEKRKLKALTQPKQSIWFGLGMFGMIGWSIAVPTLVGAVVGIWLDKNYPQPFSWTLSAIILGIVSGGLIAAKWIFKEDKEIHQSKKKEDD